MDEISTNNPLTGPAVLRNESSQSTDTDLDLRASLSRGPSQAYLQSKKRSARNHEALDFEFKDHGDETADIPGDLRSSTTITPIQKLRKIGKKTVSMAICLLVFGTGMIISSFFYLKHVSDGGKGFILFFMIGLCAIIPGAYATYNVIGKYNGWAGFETELPSYDRRIHFP